MLLDPSNTGAALPPTPAWLVQEIDAAKRDEHQGSCTFYTCGVCEDSGFSCGGDVLLRIDTRQPEWSCQAIYECVAGVGISRFVH